MIVSKAKKQKEEEYKRELGRIIDRETRDKHFDFATVTNLELSADFKYAKVYLDLPGSVAEKEKAIKKFNKDSGFFRTMLAKNLNPRHTPEITFYLDRGLDRMANIEKILKEEKLENKEPDEDNS